MSRKLALILFMLVPTFGWALQDQTYGLGGTTSGRVSGVTAEENNPYAALLNPAILAASPFKRFGFSMSRVNSQIEIPESVRVDGPLFRTRSGDIRDGKPEIPQVRTSLFAAGFNYPFNLGFWPNHRGGFGMTLSGPMEQFRRWLALSAYDFTALRYGAADMQFKGTLGAGLELIPDTLFIGGGLSLYLTSAGMAEATLTSENPTSRLIMDVGFNTAVVAGLYGRRESWSSSLVFRQAVNPSLHQLFVGTAEVGGVPIANQPAAIQASLYYEPTVIEWDLQKSMSSAVASIGVAFQQWSGFQPRYLDMATKDASGRSLGTVESNVPMRDTWNPRASFEWRGFRNWRIAAGYQYRPNAILDLSGVGNLLDTDTHIGGLSVDYTFGPALSMDYVTLSLFGQGHFLNDRVVTKSSADYIGAPGYTIGGNVWVLGASLTAQL